MPNLQSLITRLAEALGEAGITYMLIGGQAVLRYGEPRLTEDIDMMVGISPDQYKQLLAVVKALGLRPGVDDIDKFVTRTHVLPCVVEGSHLRVDFIFADSPYEQQAIARSEKIMVGNVAVCFVRVEDLIIHKVIASRARDLEDVRGVLLKHPTYDKEYVCHWLAQFGSILDQPLVKVFEQIANDAEER